MLRTLAFTFKCNGNDVISDLQYEKVCFGSCGEKIAIGCQEWKQGS